MINSWINDRLKPRIIRHGRVVYQRLGPDNWLCTFNEGGKWLTVSLWKRLPQTSYKDISSGFRIWFGPHIKNIVEFQTSITIRIPTKRRNDG